VSEVFGLAGGKLGPLLKAIAAEPRLRYLGVRHEASAGFMAAGATARNGRLALCLGETTPGGLNLASALGVAHANSLRVLAITSDHARGLSDPSRGAFSSGDNRSVFAPVTKWNARIVDTQRIPELIRAAVRAALIGRPGPVHLDIPTDVLAERANFDLREIETDLDTFAARSPILADPYQVERAAILLQKAERPLLIAGGGAVAPMATKLFRSLTERLGATATSTQMGLGVVASTSDFFIGQGGFIGGPAVARALREADVILGVGCRFSSWMWTAGAPQWRDDVARKLIQIDLEPQMMGVNEPLTVGLIGDAAAVLGQILTVLGETQRQGGAWEAGLLAERKAYLDQLAAAPTHIGGRIHPAAAAQVLGRHIGPDDLVVMDGGHTTFWSNEATTTVAPRTRFHDPGMSHLGFGTCYALAMKWLEPQKAVFQITGDGAFGFTLQELDTARRYGLNAVHIIHNNAAFGVIGFSQDRQGFRLGEDLSGTDYAAIARGFGCFGERVERLEQIEPALERAQESGLPAVIDLQTAWAPHPMLPMFGRSSTLAEPSTCPS
jgi:acetolactate synthase-1/2/3 large subunit